MSSFSRIGLGALATLVAMVAAASPALAANVKTVYAQNAQVEHKVGDPYTGPMNGALSSEAAKFATSLGTVTCNESTMNGTITDSGAGDGVVNGTVEVASFGNNGEAGVCPSSILGAECTVTANNLGWEASITAPVEAILFNFTNPSLTFNCGFGDCTYSVAMLVGTVSWNPAGISLNSSIPRTAGGFPCPASGTVEVVYSVTGEDDAGGAIDIQVWTF